MISMLLTFKSFLMLLRYSHIVLQFLKILAILVLVSYKPVSFKIMCKHEISSIARSVIAGLVTGYARNVVLISIHIKVLMFYFIPCLSLYNYPTRNKKVF